MDERLANHTLSLRLSCVEMYTSTNKIAEFGTIPVHCRPRGLKRVNFGARLSPSVWGEQVADYKLV